MKKISLKEIISFFVAMCFIAISAFGLYYINEQSSKEIEVYRIKKDKVYANSVITTDDYYKSSATKGTYSDVATVSDLLNKVYTADMFKEDIIRKNNVTVPFENVLKLSPNECVIGLKSDLVNSAGALIDIGDEVIVTGFKKSADGFDFITEQIGSFEVVSVKNDKGIEIKEAIKSSDSNNLVSIIPAVISIKINLTQLPKFNKYEEFKLVKK